MTKTILVIDDDQDILTVTQLRLEAASYKVITALSGEEGLNIIKKNNPDLILLDLLLPKIQGQEICRQLKKDPKYKKIPVVIFTASSNEPVKIMKEIGANDYISKPYESKELLEKIKNNIK